MMGPSGPECRPTCQRTVPIRVFSLTIRTRHKLQIRTGGLEGAKQRDVLNREYLRQRSTWSREIYIENWFGCEPSDTLLYKTIDIKFA